MTKLALPLIVLPLLVLATLAVPAWAGAPGHTIDDSRGEFLKKGQGAFSTYYTLPEIDMWWVDFLVQETVLEVRWRVADLSHRSFVPAWEGLNFLCIWSLVKLDGTFGGTRAVVAEHATGIQTEFWTKFEYDDDSRFHSVEGEFDWANSTVRLRVPLSFFESGDTLVSPVCWSRATTQNTVGFYTSEFDFADRAPDEGRGTRPVSIP